MEEEKANPAAPDLAKGVDSSRIADGDMLAGQVDGEGVLLVRHEGQLFAVGARCPHYGAPLEEGIVVSGTIRCPWHHAAFDLRTGSVVRPPALDDLPCWTVAESNGCATVTARKEVSSVSPLEYVKSAWPESVVIIGGGAAGLVAAQTLRRDGYDRQVTILEAGPSAPYDRPNLSKDFLAGTASEDWIPLRSPSFYHEQKIDLRLERRVNAIDPSAKRVLLDDGSSVEFGALLIATGAAPNRLDLPVSGQPIHYLRTLEDSNAIINGAASAKQAVILGASFIGLEVAASLRARGLEITVVGPEARPFERILGVAVADFVRDLHESHGVSFRFGQTASSVDAAGVTLESGEFLPAQLVVAGIGVTPNTGLADAAGLATDRGILVDEFLQTSAPGIYAAGDVARWTYRQGEEPVRIEHWVVAERQGQTAAKNILAGGYGARERFAAVPFFWTKHYDVVIAYVGHAHSWDESELDGSLSANDAEVTYRTNGEVVAVATVYRDQANLKAEAALERSLSKVARQYHAGPGQVPESDGNRGHPRQTSSLQDTEQLCRI